MSAIIFHRPPRIPGPESPRGEIVLESPPELPETTGAGWRSAMIYLPMLAGAGAMSFMFVGSGGNTVSYVAGGLYALSSVGMVLGMMGQGTGEKRHKIDGERRDYLRYLTQVRAQARSAATQQRRGLHWHHPDPDALWSFAASSRLWERRPGDRDFGNVRIGAGVQRLAVQLLPPDTKPVEDLEPLTAGALRRLLRAHSTVPELPLALSLRTSARIGFSGDPVAIRDLVRALLAQAVTMHSPDDLRVLVCTSAENLADWEWVKWLPHARHPTDTDGAGPVRLVDENLAVIEAWLGDDLADRPRFTPGEVDTDRAHLVVVLDGGRIPPESQLAGTPVQGVTLLDLSAGSSREPSRGGVRLRVTSDSLTNITTDATGRTVPVRLGRPDSLAVAQVTALARQLAQYRITAGGEVDQPLGRDFGLPALLGVPDPGELDAAAAWRKRAPRDRLRVAIGVDAQGTPVELDLKESAQGGMGPHGLIIGATGSGKSELLRTLVLGLAMTHSSETLNFVLADFKGGATFLGLDALPHISAIITNLSEELPLVDRMQDALNGEMNRRQELLRAAGNFTSVHDYERARVQGAPLEPLPTLVVLVDEFSEMLASKPELTDLFVMIGRLGRSLAVHLLLASQRLDEGRLRGLETHLSYRVCLRTFSAMESRVVLGVGDAYELPSEPGHGYLKFDVNDLVRFKAAYVSGPYRPRRAEQEQTATSAVQVLPYLATRVASPAPPPRPVDPGPALEAALGEERVMDVVVRRLKGQGPPAHQVWLPPLGQPPTLDQLLPPLSVNPDRGFGVTDPDLRGTLTVPVGVVDKPFDQRRDPLVAELGGAAGHVAVVGGPQSGKSTLVRSLVTALALTHTPTEVQFYCLDFGGGALSSLADLPHVGGVAPRLAPDRVRRTVAELDTLLEQREKWFGELGVDSMAGYRRLLRSGQAPTRERHGDVFLVVDGWMTLRQEFEALDPSIGNLAARGLSFGIHVVLTANRWGEFRAQIRDLLGTRFELRLGDAFESEVDRRAAAGVPQNVPGRGLSPESLHFLTALPRSDSRDDAADLTDGSRTTITTIRDAWRGRSAPPVRLLPEILPYQEIATVPGIPIGISEADLAPVCVDFDADPHFLVFGDNSCGKSNLLRLVTKGISRKSPDDARLIIVDYRRSLLELVDTEHVIGYAPSATAAESLVVDLVGAMRQRLPGPNVTPEQLRTRSWWSGSDVYLVVDDYDLVVTPNGNPLLALLEVLPQSRDIGLHVILARSAGGAGRAMYEPFMQRMRELGSPGLVMSGARDEGALLGDVMAQRLPAGRGIFVSRRMSDRVQVQTAYVPQE